MVVFADKSRETELIDIWKQSFGDSEEYIRMFLEWNISKTMVMVYEVDGRAVSVAYLLPVVYKEEGREEVSCWYLYAAATLPEFRGYGYFGEIMKIVREEVSEPVILVPGEASLIQYYKKQGLHVWLEEKTMEVILSEQKVSGRDFCIRNISATAYADKRKQALSGSGYIEWDEHFMDYICHENKMCGGYQKEVFIGGSKYIVMYRIDDAKLNILELLSQTDFGEQKELEMCVQALLKETGCEKAKVCLTPTVMATANFNVFLKGYFNLTMG